MPKLILMAGPPGSGKDTYIQNNIASSYTYINQDSQGKQHIDLFHSAIQVRDNVVISRMNFDIQQRAKYLNPAKEAGYETEIIVLHENYETCLKRVLSRIGHPTIEKGDEKSARSALQTFFSKYQRPQEGEADVLTFVYPTPSMKLNAIVCDIDGTAANIDHRLHFVRKEEGKKTDWKSFFANIHLDTPNTWCREIVNSMKDSNVIVFCSGRPDSLRETTQKWLNDNKFHNDWLFMRNRADHREDSLVKEILLDFEIKTRFNNIKFAIDDRKRVTDMWRKRGIVCLQCDEGNF